MLPWFSSMVGGPHTGAPGPSRACTSDLRQRLQRMENGVFGPTEEEETEVLAIQGPAALTKGQIDAVVKREVDQVEAIDVHTHLLPPTHGNLLLYGIDELLTYHYLVAELFMVLPLESEEDSVSEQFETAAPTPDEFFAWSKSRQANLVFDELFIKRTPLSEACRGVLTCLKTLGLSEHLARAAVRGIPAERRLDELRTWFATLDKGEYVESVFKMAGLKYAVMTNVPFAPEEATHFLQESPPHITPRLKTALRVDPLLAGDWNAVSTALTRAFPPYDASLQGCYEYILDWVARIKPLYLMASTPSGFRYRRSSPADKRDGATPDATSLLEQVWAPRGALLALALLALALLALALLALALLALALLALALLALALLAPPPAFSAALVRRC